MAQAYTIAPLPNPLDKTTKHLTWLTNYISQVIANPACGRGSKSAELALIYFIRP